MSKKKLAGIILGCIVVIIVIVALATRMYTLSVSVSPSVAGSVSPSDGRHKSGMQVTLIASPASGYVFDHWSGDASGTTSAINITMDSDKSITAHFKQEFTLNVSVLPSGAGSVSPLDGKHKSGVQVALTASPASGYVFDHWSGDASGTTSAINIIMDSDKSITAHFEEKFTLSVSVIPSGAGSVYPSEGEYKSGAQATLTASPSTNCLFDHWSGDTTNASSSIAIDMNSDKDVTAHFKTFFSPAFSQVCEGSGIPQAAAYQGRQHPVVLLDSMGNKHDWSDELPIEWLPTTVEETQLVVFVGEERENKIETCHYHGPDIIRYRYSLRVELREAKTGNVVAVATLDGSLPRACEFWEPYSLTRLEGSHVSFDQVQKWLRRYVVTSRL